MERQAPPPPDPSAHGTGHDSGTHHESPQQPRLPAALQPVATGAERAWRTAIAAATRAVAHHPAGWRAVALSAGIAGLLAILVAFQSPNGPQQITPDTRRFGVSGSPVLVFDRSIGSVHILPGPDGQVTIKEIDNGIPDAITTHYAQHGDTITVAVDIENGLMQDTWVDFDVTVPRQSGFTTTVAIGTLEATGLGGHISLNGTNGSIWATDLTGVISLKTQSGSINLTNVKGQVTAATQNGTITTTATELDDRSTIQATSGTINFHGTLGRTGRALFQNTNGAVGLTLPPKSAFALNATSTSGSINTDFTGLSISHQNGLTEAHGAVGAGQRAQLTIRTDSGSIGVFQDL